VQIAFVDYQGDEQCIETYEIPIYVFDVAAGMEIYDSTTNLLSATGCSPFYAKLQNASTDENEIWWYYNDEENYQGGANTLYHAFTNTGQSDSVYTVRLVAKNAFECYDTTEQEITVFPNPQLQISNNATICLGDTLELFAMGANYYTWSPSDSINNIHAANPQVAPVSDTWYSVLGENFWGCIDNDSVLIQILDIPEIGITPQSDTIRIGESVNIEVFSDQENLILTWVPQYNISCYNCLYPELSPHEDTRYTLTVQDSMGCFEQHFYVDIFVIVEYTLDVPSAFTPLGHETNRIVYARGFGIKNLIEFRIYNRWGEEVFYTDDLEQGWDGYYNGKLQNIDTYKYFVKAEMWDGTIKTIKGDILLMR
jgi:gliding motility-associated-like protein